MNAASVRTAAQLAADLPRRAWQIRSAGAGAHGPRRYAWAWIALHPRTAATPHRHPEDHEHQEQGSWSLLVRRNLTTGELAFYRCYAPAPTTLTHLPHASLASTKQRGTPPHDRTNPERSR